MKRLEEIAESMRSREVPLEKAMEMFDEGVQLSKDLEQELLGFERKVETLTNLPPVDGTGNAEIEEF